MDISNSRNPNSVWADDRPLVSVIVPVYNGRSFLHQCLDAILASNFQSFELIVVDDCSTDESGAIARAKGAIVTSTPSNSGPAAARNLAASVANGQILMFIDADVAIKRDTLTKVANHFLLDRELSAVFGSYDDEPAEQNFLSQYKNLQHHFVHHNSDPHASTFWSGLGAIRRKAFLELGGFDCRLFSVPSIEDIELGIRLGAAGGRILLDKDIQGTHLKKWKVRSHLKTEVFYRALPWSRLIHERDVFINDMNLKTEHKASAVLLAISLGLSPFTFLAPILLVVIGSAIGVIAILNREILSFFARKRGVMFAALAFFWQLLYFFYSGTVFSYCWVRYALPRLMGWRNEASVTR